MEILCENEDATSAVAQTLAPHVKHGHRLLLSGPIGAGKSHFARTVIKHHMHAIGIDEDVPSPSFALIQNYELGLLNIVHIDLYRMSSSDEFYELGLDTAWDDSAVIVEWPQKLGAELPQERLDISIKITDDDQRILTFKGHGTAHLKLLEQLSK